MKHERAAAAQQRPPGAADPPATESSRGSDVQFELSDLRQDAEAPPVVPAHTHHGPRRRFWRPAVVVLLPLLALLVIATNLYGPALVRHFAPKPVPPVTLQPQRAGMSCLTDTAWSPTGGRVALLGDGYLACGHNLFGGSVTPGLVTVYDTRSGRLVASFHPDVASIGAATQAIARAHSVPPSNVPTTDTFAGVIRYQHILWSPDGSRLALTFTVDVFEIPASTWHVFLPSGEPLQPIGVLLQDPDGAHPRVLIQLEPVYAPFQGDQSVWDLHSGALVASPGAPSNLEFPGVLPPAVGYAWQPDGTLAPRMPLASLTAPTPPPLGPVGNPDGGAAFSMWQPGFATSVHTTTDQGVTIRLPDVYTWQTSFAAWSPDDRFLLAWDAPVGLLSLPNRSPLTASDVNAFQVFQPWMLPVRDAGLLSVLSAINPIDPIGAAIAWRPDGRVLAAFMPWNQSGAFPVRFYDCASGRPLAMLTTPAPAANPLPGQSDLARWSPDGTRLMLFDTQLGEVIVWGPAQLPR